MDKLNRIEWDTLWMTMAFAVAQRSIDTSTKHGAIIVDDNNRLVSLGYNSFPKDCLDDQLPKTRPDKYACTIHSETNAIINTTGSLKDATIYITGFPCSNCFGNMLNAGIKKIIYGPIGSHCLSKKGVELVNIMNISAKTNLLKIEIIKYEDINDINNIGYFIDEIKIYMTSKMNRNLTNG